MPGPKAIVDLDSIRNDASLFAERRRRTRKKRTEPSPKTHPPDLVRALPCVAHEQPDDALFCAVEE
jgi:hypothetical protein